MSMIVRVEDFKSICSKILAAVDSTDISSITETLELKTVNNYLFVNVTNREYFAQVRLKMGDNIDFHATVNANLFLKLISQITTDTIEFSLTDTHVILKANGTYKLPLIFDGEDLLELPEIKINNVTKQFNIESSILNSILDYNSKELTKGTITKTVQSLYYIDDSGCITFISGACVNSFNLEQPVKILLNNRLVKLFKLFKNCQVKFTLGYDAISEDIIQTKVKFESEDIALTAVLSCDDSLLNSVPVSAIRGRANAEYPYSLNINKDNLLQTINRLLLFSSGISDKEVVKPYSKFQFYKDNVVVHDVHGTNKEVVYYNNTEVNVDDCYECVLDLTDLKKTLECVDEQYLTINFGDESAIVIARGHVKNIIPECSET